MPKKFWYKALSIVVTLSFLWNGIWANIVLAGQPGAQVEKGKYFGQTLPTKAKIKDIKLDQNKNAKPLKQPSVHKPKYEHQNRYKAEQEIQDKRTPNSKTFKEAPGKERTFIYLEKIHYQDAAGVLREIDNTLVQSNDDNKTGPGKVKQALAASELDLTADASGQPNDQNKNKSQAKVGKDQQDQATEQAPASGDRSHSGTVYHNKANDYKVFLPSDLSGGQAIKLEKGPSVLELVPTDGDFSRGSVKDNAILYNDVFDGIDVQYTALNTKVKEDIILNNFGERNSFTFAVNAPGLTLKEEAGAIFAYDRKGAGAAEPVFILSAPYMIDAGGKISGKVQLQLERNIFAKDTVTIIADKDWLAAPERAYPVTIDPTVTIGANAIQDTTVEEGSPDVYTDNAFSYVGYDDGITSGNLERYGSAHLRTRTFMRFTLPDLGSEQKVSSASLHQYKYTRWSSATRTVELHGVNESYSIAGLTWNNQPQETSFFSSADIAGAVGYVAWDMTGLVKDWYNDQDNNGIVLRYTDETEQAEVFASTDNSSFPKPYLEITHENQDAIDPDTPLTDPSINLRPYTASGNNGLLHFAGLTADGFAKPHTILDYYTVSEGGSGFSGSIEVEGRYLYPDFSAEDIPQLGELIANGGSFNHYTDKESNWQSDFWLNPSQDTLYHIEAVATDEEGNISDTGISDSFQVYRVKETDLLPRILAFYYGQQSSALRATFMLDNNMKDDLLVENNVIFIRNPKQNQGKPYTPQGPLTDAQKKRIDGLLAGRAKHCEFGFEPINLNTGNFYYNAVDLTLPDFGGDFTISRTYNSKTHAFNGPFGNKWDFEFNKYLSYQADGSMAFDRGDGSRIYFDKNSDNTYQVPVGENYLLQKNENGFVLKEKEQTIYTFAKTGLLTGIEDKNGNKTELLYDENSFLTVIVTPSGKALPVTMDEQARITGLALPNGRSLSYAYDVQGNLISFTDADGRETTYQYDSQDRMISFIDPSGKEIIYNTYDEDNRVTTQRDASGSTIAISYFDGYNETTDNNGNITRYYLDNNFRTTKIVRPDGNIEEFTYDADNNLKTKKDVLGHVTAYAYDERGNKIKETRWDGSFQSFNYDSQNNLRTTTDFNGNTTSFSYDSSGNITKIVRPDASTVEYAYDSKGRMLSGKDPEGNVTVYEYSGPDISQVTDPLGNIYHYYYNSLGQPVSIEDPLGNLTRIAYKPSGELLNTLLPDQSITRYSYDQSGNNIAITDGESNVVRFDYDRMDRLISVKDPLGNATTFTYDPNGNKTSLVYDYRGNQLQQVTTILGQATAYQYDSQGNLLHTTFPDGLKKTSTYDSLNRPTKITDVNGVSTGITYDGLNRITQTVDSLGRVYTYRYDKNGNLLQSVDPLGYTQSYVYGAKNLLLSLTDPEGNKTTFRYNSLDKPEEITDAAGHKQFFEYDLNGNIERTLDAKGSATLYYFDPLNRLQAIKDPLANITQYTYDAAGRLEKALDPLGNATAYTYNGRGLPVSFTDALDNVTKLKYDFNGNQTELIDPEGDSYLYIYDAMNRLTESTDTLGLQTQFSYDAMNRLTGSEDNGGNKTSYAYDQWGRLKEEMDVLDRKTTYTYDPAGNVTSKTESDGNTTIYEYDLKDRLIRMTDPEGKATAFSYDALDHLVRINGPQNRTYSYKYDPLGNLLKAIDPLGAEVLYEYDPNYNLTQINNAKGYSKQYEYDALNRLVALTDENENRTSYAYDSNGNLVQSKDAIGNVTQYSYDPLNRLELEVDALGFAKTYAYDQLGNLIKMNDAKGNTTSTDYNKHGLPVKVTDALGQAILYSYDLNDQLLANIDGLKAETRYTYDLIHRLTSMTDPTGYIRYFGYDSLGNLEQEYDSAGNIKSYAYDKMHRRLAETNTAGDLRAFAYDTMGNLASVTEPNGATTAYEYDILDRLTQAIDPEGKITQFNYDILGNLEKLTKPGDQEYRYAYDPAGNMIAAVNPLGEKTEYAYNSNNLLEAVTNPLGNRTSYRYNSLNLLEEITNPLGRSTKYAYDANRNLSAQRDGNGHGSVYAFDPLNRLNQVTNPLGHTTNYAYDAVGNLTGIADANGHTTGFSYSLRGELTGLTNSLGETESYTYNPVGTVAAFSKPDGTEISYSYDILNRLRGRHYEKPLEPKPASPLLTTPDMLRAPEEGLIPADPETPSDSGGSGKPGKKVQSLSPSSLLVSAKPTDSPNAGHSNSGQGGSGTEDSDLNDPSLLDPSLIAPTLDDPALTDPSLVAPSLLDPALAEVDEDVAYDYDIMGNRTTMLGPEGGTGYTYDLMDRLTSVSFPTAEEVSYEYDELGRKSKVIYPDGKYVKYGYDQLNRIISVEDWQGQKTAYTYDAGGRRTQTTLPNGTIVKYSYDEADQLLKLENIGPEGSLISSFEYTYDNGGNIISEVQNQSGSIYTRTYTYNDADEVIAFMEEKDDQVTTYSYTYDPVGNRLNEEISGSDDSRRISYAYNEGDELISQKQDDNSISYEYDPNGNLIKATTEGGQETFYDYDSENRLIQITEHQGKIQTFGYDSDGNRLFKTVGLYTLEPIKQKPGKENGQGNGNNGNGKGNSGDNPGQGNGQEKKINSYFDSFDYFYHFNFSGYSGYSLLDENIGGFVAKNDDNNGGGNGNGNSGSNGNSGGNGNDNSNSINHGNSGNNGNNGNNQGKGNNGNGQSNGKNDNGLGQDKSDKDKKLKELKDKLKKEKGNRGKHLGWYKRADHPKNPYNLTILNNPESYEVVNYINDVSVEHTQVLMTSDQAGVYRGVYTYGLERIAERDLAAVEGVPNDPLYYLSDGHNSVTQLINPAGQVRDKYRYDPFGAPLPGGKLSPNTRLFNNPYGYNGEAHDIDSGLQYLRARYYDPTQGRFQTRDSYLGGIMQPLSLNRYIYTENNPVMYADPSGHAFMLVTAAIGAVVGGAYGAYKSYTETGGVDWKEVAKDAAIGGVVGLAGGAGAAYWLAGSATASAAAVMTGATVAATGAVTTAAATVSAAYKTVQYASTSFEAAKNVAFNTAATHGPAAVTETLTLATWFGGDVKEYGQYKAAEIAFAKIGGPLGAQLSRLIRIKTKSCGDVPSIGKQQLVNLPSGVIEGAGKAKIPNPYGKSGGPAHQAKISETAKSLENQGFEVSFEKRVETPGGNKNLRYGDILAKNPETGEEFIIQVGKQTKLGNPISRENKAIKDLESAGWKVEFKPYN